MYLNDQIMAQYAVVVEVVVDQLNTVVAVLGNKALWFVDITRLVELLER